MVSPGLRWAVLVVTLDPVEGHEQGGSRRALVVSYEPLQALGLMTVCPITASHSVPRNPLEVPVPAGEAGQTKDGLILVHQLRTISILRAAGTLATRHQVGLLSDPELRQRVRVAAATLLGLDIPSLEDGAIDTVHYR